MQLAKPALDLGLFTNDFAAISEFWVTHTGVAFDHLQPVSPGVNQHRFTLGDGVLKINEMDAALSGSPIGFSRVLVGCDGLQESVALRDPDGTSLVLWPRGLDGIEHWAVEVVAPSEDVFLQFYEQVLGLPRAMGSVCAVRCGVSLIVCKVAPDEVCAQSVGADINDLRRRGLSYITLQVKDVDGVVAKARQAGTCVALEPVTLGETARIAFVRDPVGSYIELSQRASLTGALPK